MGKSISVSEVVQSSWTYLKSQIWVLVGLFIGYLIVYGIMQGISAAAGGSIIATILVSIIALCVQAVFMLGYYKNIFQTLDGEEPQFSAYGEQMPKLLNAIIASIVVGLAVVIGLFLLVIPGIYLMIRLMFTMQAIVEKNLSAMDAIKYSWDITKGYEMPLFLVGLASIGIIILGLILLGIGFLIAAPLVYVMSCYVYRILSPAETVEEDIFVKDILAE